MKYRKKPVEVEAIRWTGINLKEVKEFVGESLICIIHDEAWKAGKAAPYVDMKIKTLEGVMEVTKGDYIIKGVEGEYYPCKPNIFEKTYEKVEEDFITEKENTIIQKFNRDGKLVYIKRPDGYEKLQEYDDKGKLIHYKSPIYEEWKEYDENGNCIHGKDSDGFEFWKEYDENGNCIHSKNSKGFEERNEYDEKGKLIHYKDSDGREEWKEYDENGNLIYEKNSDGTELYYENIYED